MINLYTSAFIDIDPLLNISIFKNQCFLDEDVQKFDITSASGTIFFDHAASKYLKEDDNFVQFKKGKKDIKEKLKGN
jgi:hypothetical protein